MQLKYLNFHKLLANFAGNLVGAFVALIVYQYTHSFSIVFLFLIWESLVRIIANIVLKKLYFKSPQIMLLFRVFTMILYNVFILIIDKNIYLCVTLIYLFKGLDNSLNGIPNEAIFNYSSLNSNADSMGLTRLVERIGIVVATIVGGFILDINKTIIIAISIGLYLISLLPLLIFYFKSRKSNVFNKDAISNAIENLYENEDKKITGKKSTKELLFRYFCVYSLFAVVDIILLAFKFHIFETGGKYSVVGIYMALFQAACGIGSYVFGVWDSRKDTSIFVSIACVILAVINILLIVFSSSVVLGILCFLLGLFSPVLSIYILQRFLIKSRILGVSNKALLYRDNACQVSYILCYGVGAIGGVLLPLFIFISVCLLCTAFVVPYNEEKTRKLLVDILQNNEIKATKKRKKNNVVKK